MPKAPLLLYVGRVSAEKEIDKIPPVLRKCLPAGRLAIVGNGPAKEELEAHFRRY